MAEASVKLPTGNCPTFREEIRLAGYRARLFSFLPGASTFQTLTMVSQIYSMDM